MNKLIWIVGLLSLLSISACSDNSGGLPPVAPGGVIDGTVTDAVIIGGTLRVYAFDNGVQGNLIAETITDNKGDFVLNGFTSIDRPVVIEVTGGRYTEEASGVSVNLIPGQVLRAYLFYEQGSDITVQVTSFTHLATCLADSKIRQGVNVNNAITESTSVFSGLIGVDILGTKPYDITDPNNANFEVTDNLRYGAVLAAISSYTAEVSVTNGVLPHRFNQNSSIYATQVMCQDISADGIFNGLGFINNGSSVGQLSLGSVSLDVETLRSMVAQHILSIMGSDRNETTLGVDAFVLYANEVASSTDAVFGGVPAQPVDNVGPVVTADLAPDNFLKDIVNLSFTVSDPIGVKTVQFTVNGIAHSAGQVANPVMAFNSTNYSDGVVGIGVIASDILNNESTTTFNYVIDNSSPIVALTSSLLVNNKNYTARGTFVEQGAPVTSIVVNGVNAVIDTSLSTWSADVVLLSGDNVVEIVIADSVGNTNTVEVSVGVDLIFPIITPGNTQARFTNFQGQLNLCDIRQLNQTSGKTNPVCISTDNVSLNGTALTGALDGQGYVLLGFSPTDPQGAGVFTSQDDIVVEYKYELNNIEVLGWGSAPIAEGNLFYYFPMVTEYLGANWYQTTTNDVHKVTFRVTDNAGNSTEEFFEVRFDVLVPEMAITTTVDDSLFTSTTFASRSNMDGSHVDVIYSFENTSNSSLLISLTDNQLHSVAHTYETGIRENSARVKVSELWSSADKPVNSVTNYKYHINPWKTITPPTEYSAYQPAFRDSPFLHELSGVPVIAQLADYTCHKSQFFSFKTGTGKLGIYANGNASFAVCTFYELLDEDWVRYGAAQNFLTSSIQKTIEIEPGYPKNNVTTATIDYLVNTESMSVLNATLGQTILPVGGYYRVPPRTEISVIKKIRLPVLSRFYDNELADLGNFSSYSTKKLDKTTTWNIDTDLTIHRVIDTGDIQNVNNTTASVSSVGDGVFSRTIGR